MRDAWRLAVGTFLAVPTAPPTRVDGRVAGRAMLLAPATAVPAGIAWVAIGALVWLGVPALLGAALALLGTTLMSRAMHLDGLADTADALTSGYDRDRALDIMKRGNTGPAGAAAIVLTLLVQAAALGSLFATTWGTLMAVTALVASRLAPAVACRRGVPAARPSGLGAAVAGTVSGRLVLVSVVVLASVGTLAAAWLSSWPYAAGLVVVAAAAGAWGLCRHAARRLGGVTGDVIGAAIEVALATALVGGAVLAALLP